jgi:hypothetical protein
MHHLAFPGKKKKDRHTELAYLLACFVRALRVESPFIASQTRVC